MKNMIVESGNLNPIGLQRGHDRRDFIFSKDQIAHAKEDLEAQADPNSDGIDALEKRYSKVQSRDFDGNPAQITEADALIAYLQMLGTLVDFKTYHADAPENRR